MSVWNHLAKAILLAWGIACGTAVLAQQNASQNLGDVHIYLAPNGSDAWSGLAQSHHAGTSGPVKSLERALDISRAIRGTGKSVKSVHIEITEGRYALLNPIQLGPEDSTEACPLTIEAAPGAHPILSAGRRITGWHVGPGGVWSAQVPDVAAGKWYFEQLWVNGKRAVRARTPNKFYSYMAGKSVYGIDPETGKPGNLASRAFKAYPQDIKCLDGLSGQVLNDATVVVLHSWEASRLRVARVDKEANTLVTTGPAAWNFMEWGPTQRYYIENVRAALDTPGEWFLSRNGLLEYLPLPGEKMGSADVEAPATELFATIQGTPGKPVAGVTIRGLRFLYGQRILEAKGHSDGQAAATVPATITANYCTGLTIQNCEIGHIGIYGVWLYAGCTHCTIDHCWIHDMGAGAVRIGQGWEKENPAGAEYTGFNTVSNSILQSGGQLFPGCVGVWIGHSGDNHIVHNDIGDYRYTGVSVGWRWGYAESVAKRNIIEYNHIHHIGWGVLSDMGGIYTLGPSDGSVLRGNVVHDVFSYDKYGRGGWGLYNDEGTTHMLLENNLVYRTKTGGYHQHYGKENIIKNNIFAFSMDGQLQRSRVEAWVPFTFQNNIVIWKDSPLFSGTWTDVNMRIDHNLYYRLGGQPVSFAGMSLENWQAAGRDEGSLVADPGFKDPEHGNFTLPANSPALKTGFVPFNYSLAGVTGDRAWIALAKQAVYPPVEFAPPPPPAPPMALKEDFELLPIGAPCPDAQNNTEGKGDSIQVTDETARTGKHSLKITDAPGLVNGFDPHLVFSPAHKKGTTVFKFSLRCGPGVRMYHEWRDWSKEQYRVGPSFWVQGGKLVIAGKPVMEFPQDTWVDFEVRAGVGTDSDGTWTMRVQPTGTAATIFNRLPCEGGKLATLTWAGFSSMATEHTVFYLDDLNLSSE